MAKGAAGSLSKYTAAYPSAKAVRTELGPEKKKSSSVFCSWQAAVIILLLLLVFLLVFFVWLKPEVIDKDDDE